MPRLRNVCSALVLIMVSSSAAVAQTLPPPPVETVKLSGPRFGFTALGDELTRSLNARGLDVRPTISQFGWQFEKQFYSRDSGMAALNEWVVLLGGVDQGVVIPSLTWLVGFRSREGAEFAVGPNLGPSGAALALAAGVTFRSGALNVPVNVAVVPSKHGTRVSVLSGFNFRGR
jgi:hypothetical protein